VSAVPRHAALLLACVVAAAAVAADAPPGATPRYTFTWPLGGDALAPRGGTTRGPELALDREASAAWRELQQPALAPRERDRRAILAMAGSYRVSFDFLEIAAFAAGGDGRRDRPYQSWGTEKVYVDRDDGREISLVHILEMRIVDKDGKTGEPIVTKHWRQTWRYEPATLVEYLGANRWRQRELPRAGRAGQWSQTVLQVDESPRYASIGRWQHSPSFSTWISNDTWRPLPRREWSVRKDYQVLVGTNRHTVTPWGWLQEENNLKTVLDAHGSVAAQQPYLGREYGVARYERLKEPDFAAADQYYRRSKEFWDEVERTWSEVFARQRAVTLQAQVDQAGLFAPLFEYADALETGTAPQPARPVVRKALRAMGVTLPD
jgi:hypothetical protein